MYTLALLFASLLPAAFASPITADDPPSGPECCNEASKSLVWSVTDLYFHSSDIFTTPAHQNPSGFLSFNLTNSATDTVTECSAYSTRLSDYFDGDQWFKCSNTTGGVGDTFFRYGRASARLDVNQTWTCTDGPDPVTYTASGNGTQPLNCQSTEYHNPNWTTPGTVYAAYYTDCEKASFDITPYLFTAVA